MHAHTTLELAYAAVPIGEQQAERQKTIWRRFGLGAEGSMRPMLKELIETGQVKRKQVPISNGAPGTFAWLYWREAT